MRVYRVLAVATVLMFGGACLAPGVMAQGAARVIQEPAGPAPRATAYQGCMPVYIPPGLETGDFATGLWVAYGPVYIGGNEYNVYTTIQDNFDGVWIGKAGHVYKGTETALYDFGGGNTFTTTVTFVSQHQNDPSHWTMTATERIVSGTGKFANATGLLADNGYYGLDSPETSTGWAYFAIHGTICNVR